MSPRWQEADKAVESLVATLTAAAARTADPDVPRRPRGRSSSKRRPKNVRRHIADVIRSNRLAPSLDVDRNMVAALFFGHRDLVTNPELVVAVAQACSLIAGRKLSPRKAARIRAESVHVGELIARADADSVPVDAAAPSSVPVSAAVASAAPVSAVAPGPRRRWWPAAVALLLLAVVLLAVAVIV
jgi:hypothetical protein